MSIKAGAAQIDISPVDSQFLFGYPHIERYSTGINDPLLASALFLDDGLEKVIFIANDIIYVPKSVVKSARERIHSQTGVVELNIMITATHTHSGPKTIDALSNAADPIVPKTDSKYMQLLEDGIVEAAVKAYESAQPAQIGLSIGDDTGVGTNRRDPKGPADHNMPVMVVRSEDGNKNIACMLVCSMHPTVLHEDSTLVSGDFPGLGRLTIQNEVLGKDCVVLHHSGPCGNQSPRHVTKANTFEEAKRLGEILANAVRQVLQNMKFVSEINLAVKSTLTDLPKRVFPPVETAAKNLENAIERLATLRKDNAEPTLVRTAECDWFGAEETLVLAKASAEGKVDEVLKTVLPAEIQLVKIGQWNFVAWPGEIFVDYSLEVKEKSENTFVISIANGELQGYIVTEEASNEGGYEASNTLISYRAGDILVEKTLQLLESIN